MVSCFNGSKGRLKNLSDGLSNDETVSDFDRNGNRSSTELPDGRRLNYLYYGSGHLHHINLEGETVSDLERDGLHREIGRSQGALSSRYELDPLGRLKSQLAVEEKGKGSTGAGFTAVKRRYHYDRNGNLSESSDQRGGTTPFEYDPLGRITRAGAQTFAFDPAHNILDPTAQQPVSGNRLQRYNGHSYYYDDYGNTVQHETADGSQHNLYYDLYDRLEKAEVFRRNESGGWDKQTWVYQYDALDRRIRKGRLKEDGGLEDETRFVWDGSRLLQEVYARGRYTYVYADQDSYEPLAQIHNYTNAGFETYQEINYFHCDQIGIPREMTDKDGRLLWFGNYDGWGRLNGETNITGAHQPFRLQNQYCDAETGLHYNLFRYYDPNSGRFVNQDPIGLEGGDNLYAFAPNAQGWVDPLGLWGAFLARAITVVVGAISKVASKVVSKLKCGKCAKNASHTHPLRQAYVNEVNGLKALGEKMARNGVDKETIARILHSRRRELGIKYKNLTPPDKLREIYARNVEKYGDKLGPSIDWLRKKGKSWDDIIESASRTGGKDLGL